MRGRAPFYLGVSLAALMVGGGALTGAEALFPVAGEDGLAILFADADPDLAINWASTPASEYNGAPFDAGPIAGEAGKLSFTRASLAMKYNASGVLEFSGHNLITQSQTFDNAAWTKNASTISANATTAPDGTTTADKLVENSASANHYVLSAGVTIISGISYRLSFYAKAAERSYVAFQADGGGGGLGGASSVDLTNGTVISSGAGCTVTVDTLANGWYRINVTAIANATSAQSLIATRETSGAGFETYTGDGASGIYLWGAQLQQLPCSDTTYYPTTTAAVFKHRYDHNPSTLAARGLLVEEQRTNLALRSQEFDNASWTKAGATISANAVAAPDGTTTADTLTGDGAAGSHQCFQSISFTSGTAYTYSCYFKKGTNNFIQMTMTNAAFVDGTMANFDLDAGTIGTTSGVTAAIQNVGNGWYRCSITATADATTSGTPVIGATVSSGTAARLESWSSTATVHMWGGQMEAGAFATSYIPTTSASVTRAQDKPTIANSLFPFSTSAGTLYARFEALNTGNFAVAYLGIDAAGSPHMVKNSGIFKANIWGGPEINNNTASYPGSAKAAFAFASGDSALAVNGTNVTGASAMTIVNNTTTSLGHSSGGTFILCGWLHSIFYVPRRMTNGDIITVTT